MYDQEPYNKVEAGIMGKKFDADRLVVHHIKIGEQSSSSRIVRLMNEAIQYIQ
jgi:hypothetical protein